MSSTGDALRLFVGDDWAEDHHDVELMDGTGRRLAKARLPEGVAGMAWFHAMVAAQVGDVADEDVEVLVGIETDRGTWVRALVAAGYTVFGVNPLQASRYRARLGVSGAKSDAGDAHMLADMVRTDSHQLRPVAGDTVDAEAVKVLARMHKTLIWERTRTGQRLRHALREYFPAALAARYLSHRGNLRRHGGSVAVTEQPSAGRPTNATNFIPQHDSALAPGGAGSHRPLRILGAVAQVR